MHWPREGKAVVWIDGGLHASESVGSQQLMEMVYQIGQPHRSRNHALSAATTSCSVVQANPDGQELIANWYMRGSEKPDAPLRAAEQRSMSNLPRLYAKYIGHDDNRDFYMSNMKETTNMNRHLFHGVVSADHVQPPPDRAGRRGDFHTAVPRSVQL